jgi:hypothetical protein
MHGYAGPVERKIRVWVAQQERDRRKGGPVDRLDARGELAVKHRRHPESARPREQWL